MSQKFYITTAIDYVNSKPHLGTAFEKIGADAIARYRRRRGFDVLFVMGNDEHSMNVQRKAKEAGLEPLRYCDEMEQVFRGVWQSFGIRFDDFIRTTEARHRVAVETLFRKIDEAGDLYQAPYEGLYCESCEAFKSDDDLENGLCKIHGIPVTRVREQNLFFRLSKYTDRLLAHFREHPEFMEPERYRNEMIALLERGLLDIAVSREQVDWGIAVPGHPGQVVWVWFDALINYISALGYGSQDAAKYSHYWPCDVHVVGKDINRFHSVIWPAMLMAAGEPIPRKVWAHGWVHFGGQKLSKTRGVVISLDEALARHGADALRYFLLREVPFDRDGDFTWERFDERYNTDLANTWGNLLSRVVTMVQRARPDGVSRPASASLDPMDERLRALLKETIGRYCEAMDGMLIHAALDAVWALLYEANFYVDRKEPWKLAKQEQHRVALDATLRHLLVVLREVSVLLAPVLPGACKKAWEQLGSPGDLERESIDPTADWDRWGNAYRVVRGDALFPREELGVKSESGSKRPVSSNELQPTPHPSPAPATASSSDSRQTSEVPSMSESTASHPAPASEPLPEVRTAEQPPASGATGGTIAQEKPIGQIEYDDFAKVQLRVGHIQTAERVKKSDRLLRLTVDLGEGQPRQILAGIAAAYSPEQLPGRKVVVVANLKARKIFGFESHGMLLVAQTEGKMELLAPGDLPPGSKVS